MVDASRSKYAGPIRLAVFDWSGTTIDYGCMAPAAAFVEGFRRKGINITMAQAREPMGMGKRDHTQAISRMPAVAVQWEQVYHRPINAADVDEIYSDFVTVLLDVLADHTELIPGTIATVRELRKEGIKIGSTTGYFEEALALSLESAANQGYIPDFSISATEVPSGRPAPWMIFETMKQLGVYPTSAVVKVGDTVPDIEAGLNAGVWTVGVAQTGNEVGMSQAEWMALEEVEQARKLARATDALVNAGAHFVIGTVAELPAVIEAINLRLSGKA